jgi:hypothetical protein
MRGKAGSGAVIIESAKRSFEGVGLPAESKSEPNGSVSGAWFRSRDLWVMSPSRSHCATPLVE